MDVRRLQFARLKQSQVVSSEQIEVDSQSLMRTIYPTSAMTKPGPSHNLQAHKGQLCFIFPSTTSCSREELNGQPLDMRRQGSERKGLSRRRLRGPSPGLRASGNVAGPGPEASNSPPPPALLCTLGRLRTGLQLGTVVYLQFSLAPILEVVRDLIPQ
jgi:hypothetical protein